MDRYYNLASDVLVDICCMRYVILYTYVINVFSSSGNYLASANKHSKIHGFVQVLYTQYVHLKVVVWCIEIY
jgi:hypothetical protein